MYSLHNKWIHYSLQDYVIKWQPKIHQWDAGQELKK
jgi:hypothetical protein